LNFLNAAAGTTGTTSTNLVFSTSPTLVTPTLGAATATSINNVALTNPGGPATLTLANGSTLATAGAFSTTLTATGATNVTLPTSGTLLAGLSGTEVIDFNDTGAGSSTDVVLATVFTGASPGDAVVLGVPPAAVPADGTFMAWVSAANTVTVRFANNNGASRNPASGTFTVKIIK
jgi:hypothetical protein